MEGAGSESNKGEKKARWRIVEMGREQGQERRGEKMEQDGKG